ncbi:hypothetical protein GWK47_021328 [Chionoecetes opilio]|uniref:Uncharacterized protein n=1 Tax=Chionoecetes opilio TaxID=41210 RepID=A0A8J4XS72_CHIOP|nr:hypothetical protein GWK47_021328 [Chionoecetes opilio]
MFHAFTGCDTVSCFGGRGKKTAWDTWTTYGDVTPAFCALGAMPDPRAIDAWMQPLERFVVLLYDRTSTEEGVNQARKQLFSRKGRAIDRSASYTGCTHPTHQESCLPGWSLLGPNDDPCSRASVTK